MKKTRTFALICMFTMILGAFSLNAFAKENDDAVTAVGCGYKDLSEVGDYNVYYKIGNVISTDEINIKDATAIQKHLADIAPLSDYDLRLADTNNDKKINIKDSTTVQKYLANIECDNVIGKYLWQLDENRAYININGEVSPVYVGDVFTYTVELAAAELFENIQGIVTYDNEFLELVRIIPDDPDDAMWVEEAKVFCPNLNGCFFNADLEDEIRFNASNIDGFDFTEDKILLELQFEVAKPGETEIDLLIEYMTIVGDGSQMYFCDGEPVITDGIRLTERLPIYH